MSARADIHVHSKYSDRPSEWILRRIGSPESFVEPLELYRIAINRGMKFVTISDHNCITGALEIAHLPGTFLSTEVTTYFPEDGCKIHCLVTGITERQFEVIDEIRESVYDFRKYLEKENIVYSVAHPLFRVNDRLTVNHFEKLVLLFDRFEAINGTRDPRACELSNQILTHLTPELIDEFANKHDLAPVGSTPWKKTFTGGSDDHSGRYIAHAYTETPEAETVDEFIDHIRHGRQQQGGEHGTSLLLAHCFYAIGYGYYKARILGNQEKGNLLISELFRRLVDGPAPKPQKRGLFGGLSKLPERFIASRKFRKLSNVERDLIQEASELFKSTEFTGEEPRWNDQKTFKLACDLTHTLVYSFMKRFGAHMRAGELIDSLQSIASLAPVGFAMTPYVASFKTQHKDEQFLQKIAGRFPATQSLRYKSNRRAWLTDTIKELNGVSTTIRTLGALARRSGKEMTVVTSVNDAPRVDMDLKNFEPIGEFQLPEYENQLVAFPPFMEMFEYLEREKFSELMISTPGPVGLVGLAAANLLGLRKVGIYHTDFPEYVLQLTGDLNLEQLTWKYMVWFYDQMDLILVPSQSTRKRLLRRGFDPDQVRVVGRGVDTQRFTPDKRKLEIWSRYGLNGSFKFIYVGRVSKEKNLEYLFRSFTRLREENEEVELVVVGDGPAYDEFKNRYAVPGILFTGALQGEELSEVYASADAFVFPSKTDTYGNVILEAHASGLPAIVVDHGGPPEIIRRHDSGIVVDDSIDGAFTEAMHKFLHDSEAYKAFKQQAIQAAKSSTWDKVLEDFWRVSSRDASAEEAVSV